MVTALLKDWNNVMIVIRKMVMDAILGAGSRLVIRVLECLHNA